MKTPELLSAIEAAAILGVSSRRVGQFCREGRLGFRVGNQYVIPAAELRQFAKVPRPTGNPNFQKRRRKS